MLQRIASTYTSFVTNAYSVVECSQALNIRSVEGSSVEVVQRVVGEEPREEEGSG